MLKIHIIFEHLIDGQRNYIIIFGIPENEY